MSAVPSVRSRPMYVLATCLHAAGIPAELALDFQSSVALRSKSRPMHMVIAFLSFRVSALVAQAINAVCCAA